MPDLPSHLMPHIENHEKRISALEEDTEHICKSLDLNTDQLKLNSTSNENLTRAMVGDNLGNPGIIRVVSEHTNKLMEYDSLIDKAWGIMKFAGLIAACLIGFGTVLPAIINIIKILLKQP